MKPFVIDANVMNYFQMERVNGEGVIHGAINSIFEISCIALDEDGKCRQEWLDCARGTHPLALDDWINDKLVEQKIRLFRASRQNIFKDLTKLGIPSDDHKWVKLSIGCEASALVTEDVDLIDPTKKKASEKTKSELKENCNGPVAKALRKHYGVFVMCCHHVKSFCDTAMNATARNSS